MSPSKREEFIEWNNTVKHTQFDFQKEFYSYCLSDVNLLTEGVLKFRKLMIDISKKDANDTGLDPFLSSLTIASYCNYLFRYKCMLKDSIGLVPNIGFNPKQKVSKKAMIWLNYLAKRDSIYIRHAKNGGEISCGPYLLDGVCFETKTIYEFNGCLWHGCLKCYNQNTLNIYNQCTMRSINIKHRKRLEFIKEHLKEFNLIELWEHDFNKMFKSDTGFKKYLSENDINLNEPLLLRKALYGGRTNALKLYHNCENGEKIRYIDVTSLYPYVQKYGIFPKGHPRIITDVFDYNFNAYF